MSERIIDKIRKLHAHAQSAEAIGNMAEAEAFAARVQELLLAHKLEMSSVAEATLDAEDPMLRKPIDGPEFGQADKSRRENWTEQLAGIVAQAHFCAIAVNRASNSLSFYGRQSDVEIALFMFVYLARIAAQLAREETRRIKGEYRKVKRRTPGAKQIWRHKESNRLWPGDRIFTEAFHRGFRQAIWVRYSKQRRAAETNAETALVLARSTKAAEDFMSGSTSKANALSKSRRHTVGEFLGWVKGQDVDLDRKGVHGRAAAGQLTSGE